MMATDFWLDTVVVDSTSREYPEPLQGSDAYKIKHGLNPDPSQKKLQKTKWTVHEVGPFPHFSEEREGVYNNGKPCTIL